MASNEELKSALLQSCKDIRDACNGYGLCLVKVQIVTHDPQTFESCTFILHEDSEVIRSVCRQENKRAKEL